MTCPHCRTLTAQIEEMNRLLLSIADRLPDPNPTFVVSSQGDERRRDIFDYIARAAEGGDVTPTLEQISRAIDLDKSNVHRYIQDLCDAGVIRKHGVPTQRVYEIVATGRQTVKPSFRAGKRVRRRA